MPVGPPWITTNNGYFFAGSKSFGRLRTPSIVAPSVLFHDTTSEIAFTLGLDASTVEEILAALEFHKRSLIRGNRICKWDDHQKGVNASTERVAAWREEQKRIQAEEEAKRHAKEHDPEEVRKR